MRRIVSAVVQQEFGKHNLQLNTKEDIEAIFHQILDKYSADRLGMGDYALGSLGGIVRETSSHIPLNRDTEILFTNNKSLIGSLLLSLLVLMYSRKVSAARIQRRVSRIG